MVLTINDLLLRKEELPIRRETIFYLPVHPVLMRDDIQLDPNLAKNLFEQAAREWQADLRAFVEGQPDDGNHSFYRRTFLSKDIVFSRDSTRLALNIGGYSCYVLTNKRGFAEGLAIGAGMGGALCPPECNYMGPSAVLFSAEKFGAYQHPAASFSADAMGVQGYLYGHHNIDVFPQALFLRNWAILYHNAALQSVADRLR